ncbi:MAG: ATP phosphoribosyltransferase, partial [Oscillospiraceae bacterium]
IIKLNGSIELAPIVRLSDVIADIVESGRTLAENNLEVLETICEISARLIVNKAAYRFKTEQIEEMCDKMRECAFAKLKG